MKELNLNEINCVNGGGLLESMSLGFYHLFAGGIGFSHHHPVAKYTYYLTIVGIAAVGAGIGIVIDRQLNGHNNHKHPEVAATGRKKHKGNKKR